MCYCYRLPRTGKTMLMKKLQQVTERQRHLGITGSVKTVTATTNRDHSDVTCGVNTTTTSSTNKINTGGVNRINTNESDITNRVIGSVGSVLNQLISDARVENKIVKPIAAKTFPPVTKVPLKQVVARQNIRQMGLTRMSPCYSKNLKFMRQSGMRFPQRGRGRSARVLNRKIPFTSSPGMSKNLSFPQSTDCSFRSSQLVPVTSTTSASPLQLSSSPLRLSSPLQLSSPLRLSSSPLPQSSPSVTVQEHEQNLLVEQPKNVSTNLTVNSKTSSVDPNSADVCDDNTLRVVKYNQISNVDSNSADTYDDNMQFKVVKYDCVTQEITQPMSTQRDLLQFTSSLKNYKSPLLHLHSSV